MDSTAKHGRYKMTIIEYLVSPLAANIVRWLFFFAIFVSIVVAVRRIIDEHKIKKEGKQ